MTKIEKRKTKNQNLATFVLKKTKILTKIMKKEKPKIKFRQLLTLKNQNLDKINEKKKNQNQILTTVCFKNQNFDKKKQKLTFFLQVKRKQIALLISCMAMEPLDSATGNYSQLLPFLVDLRFYMNSILVIRGQMRHYFLAKMLLSVPFGVHLSLFLYFFSDYYFIFNIYVHVL